ncbi:MAG: DNA-processing protein DprA [Bacilli bacterium]|nr:DNA-processing protein DprA [Bacilli bacterium]
MTAREMLIAEAIYYKGNWKEIVAALTRKDYLSSEVVQELLSSVKCKVLTMLDSDYPPYLKELYMPPLVLFYYGDISLLNDPSKCLGIIGSREPTEYGVSNTIKFSTELAKKYIIVSGLAAGIDRIAHECACNNEGKTIAILGSGIDCCYPTVNRDIYENIKKNHLLISEYPGSTQPNPDNFPIRNRIIAMLSKGLLVTEAKIRSGTLITVGHAINYGKTVMCIPSSDLGNSGCNKSIRDGAFLVESPNQVIEIMQ